MSNDTNGVFLKPDGHNIPPDHIIEKALEVGQWGNNNSASKDWSICGIGPNTKMRDENEKLRKEHKELMSFAQDIADNGGSIATAVKLMLKELKK